MIQGSAHAWDDSVPVPLTGREPVLQRLNLRLGQRAGGGWLAISGPVGAGVTRVLREAAAGLPAREGAAPLWVAPCEAGAPRLESVRRALLPWWRAGRDASLRAALESVVPPVGGGAAALLAWLAAGPRAAGGRVPPAVGVRATLAALASGGVVVADDWLRLDAPTRLLLTHLAAAGDVTVLAGLSLRADAVPGALPGTAWPLEPLAESQVELLLRRWLKVPVTARRLTPEVFPRSGGWPGRVVALVRALAHDGCLEPSGRGWAVRHWPRSWAPLQSAQQTPGRVPDLGPAAARVFEVACLLPEPQEPEVLAEAAGVKRALVEQVALAATQARLGDAPGRLWPDEAEREAAKARLSPTRLAQVSLRLAQVWSRRDPAQDRGLGDALARLEALTSVPPDLGVSAALAHVLRLLACADPAPAPLVDVLAEAAQRIAEPPEASAPGAPPVPLLLACARWLGSHGRPALASALLGARPAPRDGSDLEHEWLALAVRHGSSSVRTQAEGRLRELLAAGPGTGPQAYRGWRALAEAPGQSPEEQRRRWRRALHAVPSCDLMERADLHLALASAAERRHGLRAAAAHGRRAASLLAAQGDTAGAARAWMATGQREERLARHDAARRAFHSAAQAWEAVGASEGTGLALARQAETCLALSAHDEAVPLLESGLAHLEEAGACGQAAALHLALVRAHRGRGDLAREAAHARAALHAAITTSDRLVARAAGLLADLRSGQTSARQDLAQALDDLDASGLAQEASRVRAALLDQHLKAGDVSGALRYQVKPPSDALARLSEARLLRLTGRADEAMERLEALGRDATVPIEHRAEAYARLAELQSAAQSPDQATRSAQAASALLEVPRRDHAQDPRLYRLLARVFRSVGARARSLEHRAAARRSLRLPSLAEVGAAARRRMARSLWTDDPRPRGPRVPALAG